MPPAGGFPTYPITHSFIPLAQNPRHTNFTQSALFAVFVPDLPGMVFLPNFPLFPKRRAPPQAPSVHGTAPAQDQALAAKGRLGVGRPRPTAPPAYALSYSGGCERLMVGLAGTQRCPLPLDGSRGRFSGSQRAGLSFAHSTVKR